MVRGMQNITSDGEAKLEILKIDLEILNIDYDRYEVSKEHEGKAKASSDIEAK